MVQELSRSQIAVYGALAVVLLLIGARAVRGEGAGTDGGTFGSGSGFDSGSSYDSGGGDDGGGGSFSVGSGGGDVVVDVTGAVQSPGVYRLPSGSRVTDAVERAGGQLPGAAIETVNLAARLADGQQIVIPEAGVPVAAGGTGVGAGPVSLGSATVEQLDTIDGIGPVTAQDIIDFRDEHGGLASVEQLNEVSGIGPATMGALRDGLAP